VFKELTCFEAVYMKQKVFLLVLSLFLALAYLILWPVPVNPVSWKSSVNTGYIDDYAPNSDLANLELIDIGETHGPEDIVYYQNKIYTSSQEGIILEIDPVNLTHREYANTGGSALGMEMDRNGNLIVADAFRGLLSISKEGRVDVLTNSVDDTPILYADDLDIAEDGIIYFSDASTKFGAQSIGSTLDASLLELMEHSGTGRLLSFNPKTKETKVVDKGYVFSNGVAITAKNEILLIETGKYQLHKLQPNGESEVILQNLPGFPDNINRGPLMSDGRETFLIGLVSQRSKWLDNNSNNPLIRKVAMRLPSFMRPQAVSYGFILQIDANGDVIKTWQDPTAGYPNTTGAIITENGFLYVSSLTATKLGRIKIN
jgi:hypothetical protein